MFKASERALRRAHDLGIHPNVLPDMVRRAAPLTHPRGNKRFRDYWFYVDAGGFLHSMGKLSDEDPQSRVVFPDAVDCAVCEGTMMSIMIDDFDQSERLVPCPRMSNRQLPVCSPARNRTDPPIGSTC